MNPSIVIYFFVFAFVLGFLFFRVDGYLKTKVMMIAAMFYVSSAIVFSFSSYMGWPTDGALAPDNMAITGVTIFDKTSTSEGYIYVSGIPCGGAKTIEECLASTKTESQVNRLMIFGYVPEVKNTPRLFIFPYTEQNRKEFGDAEKNIREGGSSIFHRGAGEKIDEAGDSGQEGDATGKGKSGGGTRNAKSVGANEIYVDNKALRDIMRKDQTQ